MYEVYVAFTHHDRSAQSWPILPPTWFRVASLKYPNKFRLITIIYPIVHKYHQSCQKCHSHFTCVFYFCVVLVRIQQLMLKCEVCVIPFYVVDPLVITHPQDWKDAVLGNPAMFTVEATGTQPLNYQWEWKSAMDDGEWQLCDVERFPGADSSTLIIPNVQKSNKGSYCCVVSNCTGSWTSNPAKLSIGKYPTIHSSATRVMSMNCLSFPRVWFLYM